jgi:hypothetical protein
VYQFHSLHASRPSARTISVDRHTTADDESPAEQLKAGNQHAASVYQSSSISKTLLPFTTGQLRCCLLHAQRENKTRRNTVHLMMQRLQQH